VTHHHTGQTYPGTGREPETLDGAHGLRSVWKMMVISASGWNLSMRNWSSSIAMARVLEERIGENVGKILDRTTVQTVSGK